MSYQLKSSGNSGGPEKQDSKFVFWLPFILLFLISALLFAISKNTVIGWGLLIVLFVIIFFLRKFLSRISALFFICWIVIIAIIFAVFSLSKPGKSGSSITTETPSAPTNAGTESGASKDLQFSSTYSFPNNKGSYTVSVAPDAKSKAYILTITVSMPKEAIPEGFKWDVSKITDTVNVGTQKVVADDHVGVYWQSVDSSPTYDDTNYLTATVNAGKFSTDPSTLEGFEDATFTKTAKSPDELKKFMQTGDKLCLYWYNVSEVGAAGDDGSVQIHYEKGYGLHPSIAESAIPWSDIITSLGI